TPVIAVPSIDLGIVPVAILLDAGTPVIVPPPPVVVDLGVPVIAVQPEVVVDAGAPVIVPPPPVDVDAGTELADVDDTGEDDGDHPTRPANVASANFLTIRAARLVSDGNLRDAELLYLRALHEDPHNPHANAGLAQLHLRRHAARDALHYAEAAVATR